MEQSGNTKEIVLRNFHVDFNRSTKKDERVFAVRFYLQILSCSSKDSAFSLPKRPKNPEEETYIDFISLSELSNSRQNQKRYFGLLF